MHTRIKEENLKKSPVIPGLPIFKKIKFLYVVTQHYWHNQHENVFIFI